jgi:hypothetical protein
MRQKTWAKSTRAEDGRLGEYLRDADALLVAVERAQRVRQQREDGVGRPHQDQVVPHPRREEAKTLRRGLGRQLLCGQIYLAEDRNFVSYESWREFSVTSS